MTMDSDGWSTGPQDGGGAVDDATTEHVGFLERLWQSITGILIGLGLIAATIWGIFWNEGRAIGTTRALNEGAGVTLTVAPTRVDPANEGKLVHVAGDLRAGGRLTDGDFQITTEAVRLVRKVEMYQWKEEQRTETRSNAGGSQTRTTTYDYTRVWSDRPIDSSRFRRQDGHANPAMTVTGRSQTAGNATLGAFRADSRVIGLFGSSTERRLEITEGQLRAFQSRFGGQARLNDGGVYVGYDVGNPVVGDVRISYTVLPEGPATVVARQVGQGFGPYQASNGREVFLGETGTKTAQELYAHAHESNSMLTWILRVVVLIAMWMGFNMILRPFVVLADVIPLFGSAMAAGAGIVALALTLVVALPTFAIAWFWHRPIMSIILIVVGVAGAYGLKLLGERRRAAAPPAGGQAIGGQPGAPQQQGGFLNVPPGLKPGQGG
ncbi:MAG: TMEM43 family protein [Phreatobacter sp.]|uniref:TMEM43 family protein n=1 Tax=Phreatobacter sp. TaxID=1966341 RepID=UPI002737757D|nr:TMEM43 family protein [Phreatobacter sp.]MDP2802271.1 TMEM43 family protein [Phreatobacter sp.]